MNCDLQAISAFVDGALPLEQRSVVAQHLLSCPRCAGVLSTYRRISADLRAMPPIAAPRHLDAAVYARLDETRRRGPLSFSLLRWLPGSIPAVAVSGLLLVVSVLLRGYDAQVAVDSQAAAFAPALDIAARPAGVDRRDTGVAAWATARADREPGTGRALEAGVRQDGSAGNLLTENDHPAGLAVDASRLDQVVPSVPDTAPVPARPPEHAAGSLPQVGAGREATGLAPSVVGEQAAAPGLAPPESQSLLVASAAGSERLASGSAGQPPSTPAAAATLETAEQTPPQAVVDGGAGAAAAVAGGNLAAPAPPSIIGSGRLDRPREEALSAARTLADPRDVGSTGRCLDQPKHGLGLGEVGSAIAGQRLGCIVRTRVALTITVQTFQQGYMIRREDEEGTFVLLARGGVWASYADPDAEDSPAADMPAKPPVPGTPGRHFASLWRSSAELRDLLGPATKPESAFVGATVELRRGIVVASDQLVAFVLYADGSWQDFSEAAAPAAAIPER